MAQMHASAALSKRPQTARLHDRKTVLLLFSIYCFLLAGLILSLNISSIYLLNQHNTYGLMYFEVFIKM